LLFIYSPSWWPRGSEPVGFNFPDFGAAEHHGLALPGAECAECRVCESGTALAWLTLKVIVHILP
jgi:hypothetical protein